MEEARVHPQHRLVVLETHLQLVPHKVIRVEMVLMGHPQEDLIIQVLVAEQKLLDLLFLEDKEEILILLFLDLHLNHFILVINLDVLFQERLIDSLAVAEELDNKQQLHPVHQVLETVEEETLKLKVLHSQRWLQV